MHVRAHTCARGIGRRAMRKCIVEGCEKNHEAKDYCKYHYRRFKKGRPVHATQFQRPSGMSIAQIVAFELENAIRLRGSSCLIGRTQTRLDKYARVYHSIEGRTRKLHRLVLEVKIGRILSSRELACHSCNMRPCINPDHLQVGTYAQNYMDMILAGRDKRRRAITSLEPDQVLEIRSMYRHFGVSMPDLAKKFGVVTHTISGIVNYKSWRHLP